jgi:NAD(P)-dependent dehydrogenase (short-subunit alcohol dehydrogenase family)
MWRRSNHAIEGGGIRAAEGGGQCIAPAATMTDRVCERFEAGNPRVTKIAAAHPIGLIEPEDIANMAVFLASHESRMVTGHVYLVDSGITIS